MSGATTYSLVCEELVQHFESLHDGDLKVLGLQPKLCPAGYWTIGWGHVAIDPDTKKPLMDEDGRARALALFPALSLLEAKAILKQDLNRRLATVLKLVTVPLTQGQLDALVSFQFNTGSLPTSTLLSRVNAGRHEEAAAQFLRWNKARVDRKLVVLAGLTRRRNAERALYMGGDWTPFKSTQPR